MGRPIFSYSNNWGIKIYLTVLVHELAFSYSELEITNWDEKNAILANFI